MAHNQETLAKTPVIKFKGQDFNFLRDHCLSRGLLFEDETFPAETSSIGLQLLQGKNLSRLMWRRPKDILEGKSEPHFILEGASRFDIQQGKAGDCWFLAALGSLTQNPQHLQKILMDQSFSCHYAGIFRFRFWQCGHWVEVVVDDRLPILNREYLFVHPRNNNQEFWPCLLEKAYAKFHGSYLNLHYGFLPDALVDLTGGVVTGIDLHSFPSDLVMILKTAAKAGSLVTCGTPASPTGEARRMEDGLVSQHAYTVTGAERIQYRGSWEDLIRLWNPWGNTEWRGRWADGSPEWQETHHQWRRLLYENKDDGEEELLRDTQFIFSVPESMEDNNVVMSFNIMPQNLKAKDEKFPLTFKVFKVDPQENAVKGIVSKTKCNLTKYFSLSPGTYVVVIATYREVEFLLRIFLKMPDGDRNPSSNFSLTTLKASLLENGSQGSIFHKYAHQFQANTKGLDIDATQLQSLLNQELLRGTPGDTFSLDECRSIVALMDGSPESLGFCEFYTNALTLQNKHSNHDSSYHLSSIYGTPRTVLSSKRMGGLSKRSFQGCGAVSSSASVFQNIQKRSGVFLSEDLWRAIKDAGTTVSNQLLDLMTLRYSDHSGRVSFPSLVCFLLRLEAMAKTFQNLSNDGKGLYLTKMEWMNL
ncbi:calpain-13 isoform X3 [Prionailurus iriomotensis]